MQIAVNTPHAEPGFPSSIPPEVKKAAPGKFYDLPWFSAGAVNVQANGNGYFLPDLKSYKALAIRANKLLREQGGPRIVQLDMEACPGAPGHTGDVVEPGTPMGPPTWGLWKRAREQYEYAVNFFAPCAAEVDKVIPGAVSIYATFPTWFDGPAPTTWEEECDYRTAQAVATQYLMSHVGSLCVDVYPWPAPDGDHAGQWDRDFDAKLRSLPVAAGAMAYPELFCFWNDRPQREYVGDDLVRHMLDGCRRRGFETVAVFEPPEQAWDLLLAAVT